MLLVLNVGSSSIKYAVFEQRRKKICGNIEQIGEVLTYEQGINAIVSILDKNKISFNLITHIAHRIVHGGPLRKPTILTKGIVKMLERFVECAPLHEAPELKIVKWCLIHSLADNIGVFDTSFHETILQENSMYALPKDMCQKYGFRRYGFHGLSHQSMIERASRILGKIPENMVSCHLGSGSSITAIKRGLSFDTSMGMTPLEGVVMSSRCGSIDPSIPLLVMEHEKRSAKEMLRILNEQSGFFALTGQKDIREIYKLHTKEAEIALKLFSLQITKYIGAYAAEMGGLDVISFSGGIGEHQWQLRESVLAPLEWLGVQINKEHNKINNETVSSANSRISIFVFPANEEEMIAKDAFTLISK
ncbi:MAG: acetate/propionate family kinase [Nanoarchaeota archaeon]